MDEKYETLSKAAEGNMDVDSLVRFSCVNHYSLVPAHLSSSKEDSGAGWKALGWLEDGQ